MLFAGGASNDNDSCRLPGGGCGGRGAADDREAGCTNPCRATYAVGRSGPAGYLHEQRRVGTPFERPSEFEGRRIEDITPAEVAAVLKKRHDDRPGVQAVAPGRVGPIEWQSEIDLTKGSRLWFVTFRSMARFGRSPPKGGRLPQRVRTRNADAVLRIRGSTSISAPDALRRVCLVR